MNNPTKIALISVLVALFGALLTWQVPVPSTWLDSSGAFHWPLFYSSLYTLLYLGAAVLFLTGLKSYKSELRMAYSLIVLGIVLSAFGVAQLPILSAYQIMQTFWVESGGVLLPFIVSGVTIYVGIRKLARLIGTRSTLNKFWILLPVLLCITFLSSLLPHVETDLSELTYDVSNGITVFICGVYAICFAIALQIKQHIGVHYKNAMAWLSLSFLASAIVTLVSLIVALTTNGGAINIVHIVLIMSGAIYLKAGYAFAKTGDV